MVDTRHEYDSLAGLYGPIALGVVVVVFALVLFMALRYRRRDAPPSRTADAPRLEALYVLVLGAVAAVLLVATFTTESRVDGASAQPALDVAVTGAKWRWRFDYPASGIVQEATGLGPSTLVVPAGVTVRFMLTSQDVIHAFWIPERRFKRDAFPGRTSRFELVFPRAGYYAGGGVCSEFCGLHHAQMTFNVEALTPTAFQAWVHRRGRS